MIPIKSKFKPAGCVMSPSLFNEYLGEIFQEALSNRLERVIGSEAIINNKWYTDETVNMAENVDDLQNLLDRVNKASRLRVSTFSTAQTTWMVAEKLHTEQRH